METRTEIIAAACHSAWYAYAVFSLGEQGLPWECAPRHQKESIFDGIEFLDIECAALPNDMSSGEMLTKLTPLSHENWMKFKKDDGWTYGKYKDPKKKTHPLLVPYDELPFDQQVKDAIFVNTYLTMRKIV